MKFKWAKRVIDSILEIIKEDTLEVYRKIRRHRQQRAPRKRQNIWVGVLLMIAVSVVALYLYWPLLGGMFAIIFGAAEPPEVPTFPSPEALTSFIILSTAMGALILWFASSTSSNEKAKDTRFNEIKGLGKLFLYAALSLTLFLLLSPLLPEVRDSSDFYSYAIKGLAMLSFIGGCTLFITAIIFSFFSLWRM